MWALISGEYPPAGGGVADYTAQLAAALAAAGDEVHVWAPAPAGATPGVSVHALPNRFGYGSLRRLSAELAVLHPAPRILIQYVPHAYGRKGMNWCWGRWVWRQSRLQPWVMFHEVAFPSPPGWHPRHRLLAWTTQAMARWIYGAAARAFVTTPAWSTWLQELAPGGVATTWLPVPSNLPHPHEAAIAAVRQEWAGATVIGSFCGGAAAYARAVLCETLPPLLAADPRRLAFLAGSEGMSVRAALVADAPHLAARIEAPGYLNAAATSARLAACELLLQPYPEGVSGRRGTAMAGLALGVATITTEGRFTEPAWRAGVRLVPTGAGVSAAMHAAAEQLLDDPEQARQLGAAGRRLYQERFALTHTVTALRGAAAAVPA